MNVGPSGEASKTSPSHSPANSVAAPAEDLAKFEDEEVRVGLEGSDLKVHPTTTFVQKDAVEESTKQSATKEKKKRSWKKPEGMPKRPLSAYNIYFREQRQELLGDEISSAFPVTDQTKRKHRKSHGKVGFQEMASTIGKKWKALTPEKRKTYEDMAAVEKVKYKEKLERWRSGEDDTGKAEGTEQATPSSENDDTSAVKEIYPSLGHLSNVSRRSSLSKTQPLTLPNSMGVGYGQNPFDRGSNPQYSSGNIPALMQHQPGAISARTVPLVGLSDSGMMTPTVAGLPMSGNPGLSDPARTIPGSVALSGDSEEGRLDHLQRMYELRVREAAMLREEMERSLAQSGRSVGSAMPAQNLQSPMGHRTGSVGGPSTYIEMGQRNQQSQGFQSNFMGGGPRRMSLGSSIRSVPQQHQQLAYPSDMYMFSPGGQQQQQQQLRQAEEAWQYQLALGNQGGLSQLSQQQQMGTDPVSVLREQRARLLQQALESERVYRAEEEFQRFLRRQSGPGRGM